MSRSIRISKKHGLAPALCVCPICHKETNAIALPGSQADRMEGYGYGTRVLDSTPCETCRGHLDAGAVALVDETGCSLMIRADAVDRLREIIAGVPIKAGKIYRCEPGVIQRIAPQPAA